MFSVLLLLKETKEDLIFNLSNEFINISFYIFIVYINLLYLIPKYLNQKKNIYLSVFIILNLFLVNTYKNNGSPS